MNTLPSKVSVRLNKKKRQLIYTREYTIEFMSAFDCSQGIEDMTAIALEVIQNKGNCKECYEDCPVSTMVNLGVTIALPCAERQAPYKYEKAIQWLIGIYGEERTKELIMEELL